MNRKIIFAMMISFLILGKLVVALEFREKLASAFYSFRSFWGRFLSRSECKSGQRKCEDSYLYICINGRWVRKPRPYSLFTSDHRKVCKVVNGVPAYRDGCKRGETKVFYGNEYICNSELNWVLKKWIISSFFQRLMGIFGG